MASGGWGRGRGNGMGGGGPVCCFKCGQPGHFARDCAVVSCTSTSASTTSSGRGRSGGNSMTRTGHRARECSVATSGATSPQHLIRAPGTHGFIDTHCHLDYIMDKMRVPSFEQLLARLHMPEHYRGCITTFCDMAALSPSLGNAMQLLETPQVWGTFGLHPHNAKYYNAAAEAKIIEFLKHPKAVAWGEIGLDFQKNVSERQVQIEAFQQQLVCAVSLGKPVVIHSRRAEDETYEILCTCVPHDWRIHLHCFNESMEHAARMHATFPNLYFGISGQVVNPKNTNLASVIQGVIPIDRLLLETDAPYITPQPATGINHSGNIPFIAQWIAGLLSMGVDQVLQQCTANAAALYKLSLS
ncbi:hydrolase, TatD family protein [Pelomyxa schiedti]|nr:hydrolase, TatD family protein [Pelomyxa schiedti]